MFETLSEITHEPAWTSWLIDEYDPNWFANAMIFFMHRTMVRTVCQNRYLSTSKTSRPEKNSFSVPGRKAATTLKLRLKGYNIDALSNTTERINLQCIPLEKWIWHLWDTMKYADPKGVPFSLWDEFFHPTSNAHFISKRTRNPLGRPTKINITLVRLISIIVLPHIAFCSLCQIRKRGKRPFYPSTVNFATKK